MSLPLWQRGLIGSYAVLKSSGLLDTPAGRACFRSGYWIYKRYLEDPYWELTTAHPQLFLGGYIIDVGANIGYTASVFSRLVQSPYQVVAFEPDQQNFAELSRLAAKDIYRNKIMPICAGVAATPGSALLVRNPSHHADHRVVLDGSTAGDSKNTVPVKAVSLDSFLTQNLPGQPISFIKIDVQGGELAVCHGMVQTLLENPAVSVAFEYDPAGLAEQNTNPAELLEFFLARSFQLYRVTKRGLLPLPESDIRPHTATGQNYGDLIATRQRLL